MPTAGSPCYFFVIIFIRHETTAAARWALLLIISALFNDTITVAIWTGFHVCLQALRPIHESTKRFEINCSIPVQRFLQLGGWIARPLSGAKRTCSGHPRMSVDDPSGQERLRMAAARQVIRFRGQRLKRRLVALFLVSRTRHWRGMGAKIDLNESVDSSVDAFYHARKLGPQSPCSQVRAAIAHQQWVKLHIQTPILRRCWQHW